MNNREEFWEVCCDDGNEVKRRVVRNVIFVV
jgi:uncharacterized protein YabE (DUF348 family)